MARTTEKHVDFLIVGQGIAGSVLAWHLFWQGARVFVVDRDDAVTASRIAAGLMTPITGRRLTREADYDCCFQFAAEFYRKIESETHSQFFTEPTTIRLFQSDREQELFLRNRGPLDQLIGVDGSVADIDPIGFLMQPAGRLSVPEFLTATRTWFEQSNSWQRADIDPKFDLLFDQSHVCIPSLGLTAELVVLCQGFDSHANLWFPGIPDRPVRGDLLTVRIRGLKEQRVVHCGVWLVPLGNELFQAGSTYDWENLNCVPSDAGRDEILLALKQFIPQSIEVLDQQAAVRPAMKNRRPVADIHPVHSRLAILNGLGAKGSLRAPLIAAEFSKRLLNQQLALRDGEVRTSRVRSAGPSEASSPFVPEPAVSRTAESLPGRLSLTRRVHEQLRELLRPGDTAIDATAGNGFDTLFLAQSVGPSGRVLAYDIQSAALQATQKRLVAAEIGHVELRLESHDLLQHCGLPAKSVAAITFNLGYLPGGEKHITTQGVTSVSAVVQAAKFLRPGGMMSIIAYRGHAGGIQEAESIERTVGNLDLVEFAVRQIPADSQNPESPILFEVRRLLTDD